MTKVTEMRTYQDGRTRQNLSVICVKYVKTTPPRRGGVVSARSQTRLAARKEAPARAPARCAGRRGSRAATEVVGVLLRCHVNQLSGHLFLRRSLVHG